MSTEVKETQEEVKVITVNADDLVLETKVDGEKANIKVTNKKYYAAKAKEAGIEEDTLKQVAEFESAYQSAVFDKISAEMVTVVGDNKDLKKITAGVNFGLSGNDKITLHGNLTKTVAKSFGSSERILKPKLDIVVSTERYSIPKDKVEAVEKRLQDLLQ